MDHRMKLELPPALSPWWQHEDGLLHPAAPIQTDLSYGVVLPLPERLQLSQGHEEVSVRFPLDPSIDSLDLQVRFGRVILAASQNDVSFTRALTLPDNLDLAHQQIQLRRGEIRLVFRHYPEGTLRRNSRKLRDWLISMAQRFWSWLSPADD